MLMPTSSEFVALCRAQVVLLTQVLGASLSVVYLTQELVEGAKTQFEPVMAYPENAIDWRSINMPRSLLSALSKADSMPRLPADSALSQAADFVDLPLQPLAVKPSERVVPWNHTVVNHAAYDGSNPSGTNDAGAGDAALVPAYRVVLPLMHANVVLGLLVTERHDRLWTEWEQAQIHQIADTLAIACVLDQRYQWLEQDHRQLQQLQAQQHDYQDNLLHQVRNSLTALQTFGKLMLKRLLPGDANQEIAASLVRETLRLRDLAQQFESTNLVTDTPIPPLLLPQVEEGQPSDYATGSASPQTTPPLPLLPAAGFLSGKTLLLDSCAVMTVLEPLLASTRAIAQERSLGLHTDIPDSLPLVQANVPVLREVLSNAIDNALKYTPAGGHLLLQVRHTAVSDPESPLIQESRPVANPLFTFLQIAVTDTGPGIPPQDLTHIFERHYRGVQAQTEIPGSGLGLSIAHALMTQMHGKIQVLSPARIEDLDPSLAAIMQSQGSGTTVVVWLAIAQ